MFFYDNYTLTECSADTADYINRGLEGLTGPCDQSVRVTWRGKYDFVGTAREAVAFLNYMRRSLSEDRPGIWLAYEPGRNVFSARITGGEIWELYLDHKVDEAIRPLLCLGALAVGVAPSVLAFAADVEVRKLAYPPERFVGIELFYDNCQIRARALGTKFSILIADTCRPVGGQLKGFLNATLDSIGLYIDSDDFLIKSLEFKVPPHICAGWQKHTNLKDVDGQADDSSEIACSPAVFAWLKDNFRRTQTPPPTGLVGFYGNVNYLDGVFTAGQALALLRPWWLPKTPCDVRLQYEPALRRFYGNTYGRKQAFCFPTNGPVPECFRRLIAYGGPQVGLFDKDFEVMTSWEFDPAEMIPGIGIVHVKCFANGWLRAWVDKTQVLAYKLDSLPVELVRLTRVMADELSVVEYEPGKFRYITEEEMQRLKDKTVEVMLASA